MASMRRMRLMGVMAVLLVITIFWYTSSSKKSTEEFYIKTRTALDREHDTYKTHHLNDDAALAAAMSERLRDADAVAKDNANVKAPKPAPVKGEKQKAIVEDATDINIAGRKKYPLEKEKAAADSQTDEDRDVTVEMNGILKKSPIIIFSKSYCPHSAQAKSILVDKWDIVPKPYVVELDLHPMGPLLQAKLGTMTGRKTVPNILINGKSIGGGDETADLDHKGELQDTIKGMVGKQMHKMVQRPGYSHET